VALRPRLSAGLPFRFDWLKKNAFRHFHPKASQYRNFNFGSPAVLTLGL
jgi:hypothetical protein